MREKKMSKFYKYRQNNSGGSFVDKGYLYLVVEADYAEDANNIAEQHGVYFNGVDDGLDCECCGDRWRPASEYDVVDLSKVKTQYYPKTRIIYKDGTIEDVKENNEQP
jgi:hypothetical protein